MCPRGRRMGQTMPYTGRTGKTQAATTAEISAGGTLFTQAAAEQLREEAAAGSDQNAKLMYWSAAQTLYSCALDLVHAANQVGGNYTLGTGGGGDNGGGGDQPTYTKVGNLPTSGIIVDMGASDFDVTPTGTLTLDKAHDETTYFPDLG